MRPYRYVAVQVCAFVLVAAMVWAESAITEEEVTSVLNGKPRTATSQSPIGVALHVTFPPRTTAGSPGNRVMTGGTPRADDTLYKVLIPLARALEAEVLRGSRFVMRVRSLPPLLGEHNNWLGRQLANIIADFLATYFVISREQMSLEVSSAEPTTVGLDAPPLGLQRWRLEVFRQE